MKDQLVSAIDTVLHYLAEHRCVESPSNVFRQNSLTPDQVQRFRELSIEVKSLAHQSGIQDCLPDWQRFAYDENTRGLSQAIAFEGVLHLPGDWIDDYFVFISTHQWHDEMLTLRARAELAAQQSVQQNENSVESKHTESATVTRKKLKTGRPKRDEKDSATKVISALTTHHKYENGSVLNFEPATKSDMKKLGLSEAALSRFLVVAQRSARSTKSCSQHTTQQRVAINQTEFVTTRGPLPDF